MQTHIICLLLFLPSVYMIACPVAQFCSFAPGTCPNATQNIFSYGNYSVDLGDFNLIGLDNITVLVATIGGKVASGGQILISNQADFGNEVPESAGPAVTGIVVGNLSIIPNIYNNDNSTIIIRPSNARFLVGGSFPANYTQNKNQIIQPCGSDTNCLNSSFSQIRTYWRSVSSSIYSYAILGSAGLQKYNTPYTITLDQDGNGVLLINCKADSVLQTLLFKFGVFSLINKVQLASTCRSDALYVLTTPDSSATITFPSFSPNVILNFPYASFVNAYDVFQEAALVLAPYGQFLGPVTFTTPFRSQVVAASISAGRIVAPRTCSMTTPAPSTTGSSASTTASTGTCTNGYSRCTTSETYQTCNRGTWGPVQSCQQNLTCKPSGNFIYCT